MIFTQIMILLSILQFFGFGILVGRARSKYHIAPPAMSGHPIVERQIRIQQNTLEVLMMLLPSLWIATHYYPDWLTAGLTTIYFLGRLVYLHGYMKAPERRHLGYGLSVIPIFALIILDFFGIAGSH